MSSGTPRNRQAGAIATQAGYEYFSDQSELKLSPRQLELNRRYSWYCTEQYDARGVEWDGSKRLSHMDREQYARDAATPPGWKDFGRLIPLRFRRPAVGYHLVRIIVKRFTAMLFSEERHPLVGVAGDKGTDDYLKALIEASRFWARWKEARDFGGSTGTAAVGFKFVRGVPRLDVFDPRWVRPTFVDRESFELASLDIRYPFEVEKRDENGKWVVERQWHRRYIDERIDVVFTPLPVSQEEPQFWPVKEAVEHRFGFCPAVWVQNQPDTNNIDGEPDVVGGALDNNEAIDGLLSQGFQGTIANCFGAETRFVTDAGVRCFSDFKDGDTVSALSHTGTWRRAMVRKFGRQQMCAITMQRGTRGAPVTVRATRDHRWLLEDGETSNHIEVGDRLMQAPSTFSDFDFERATPEERTMWCRGFVWGDGSLAKGNGGKVYGSRLRLCGQKTAYAARFEGCGFKLSTPAWAGGDIVATTTMIKSLPPTDAPLGLLRAFVRGYVDADGTKGNRKSTRWKRIQATGLESIRFIREVFPAVGLYISGEVDMTGTSTNFGMRTAETVRFSLNENASAEANSAWRITAIDPLVEDDAWCLVVDSDQSFALPCGVMTRNCDPTLVIRTAEQLDAVRKGSDNAIKLEPGGGAEYLDLQASGPQAARELAKELKDMVLEASSCVLESPDDAAKTATEIIRRYAAMTACASTLREQYTDFGIKPLARKMLTAARLITSERPRAVVQVPHTANNPDASATAPTEGSTTAPDGNPETRVIEGAIFLPPRVDRTPQGQEVLVERKIGPGPMDVIRVKWPQFFEPTPTDAQAAAGAVTAALTAKLIDKKAAAEYIAPYFDVEDVDEVLARADEEGSNDQDMMNAAMGQMGEPPEPGQPPGAPGQPSPPNMSPTQQGPAGQPQPGKPTGWGALGS